MTDARGTGRIVAFGFGDVVGRGVGDGSTIGSAARGAWTGVPTNAVEAIKPMATMERLKKPRPICSDDPLDALFIRLLCEYGTTTIDSF